MEEKVLTAKNSDSIYLKPTYPHKIDPNKIQSVDDIVEILKRIPIYVNEEGAKGIEHLIEKDAE